MRNPVERIRMRLARRRYMPRPHRSGPGTTARIAMVALVVIIGAAAMLELRRGDAEAEAFLSSLDAQAVDPMPLLTSAARTHRLLLLSDIAGSSAAKRFAAEAIDSIAHGSGLDAVALEVGSDQQQWIDLYLASRPEATSILLQHPATLHEEEGTGRDYLEVYRTVWRVNEELGAARSIRIVALDVPGWGANVASPSQAAERYGERDAHMVERIDERILARNARGRILFFVDGLRVLRGTARAQTGGTDPVPVTWLAEQLDNRSPGEVYSVLLDAPPERTPAAVVARYHGTTLHERIRRAGAAPSSRFALRVDASFDFADDPMRILSMPGLTFELQPRAFRLAEQVDAYIYLGR
jgi:hypothetical protein